MKKIALLICMMVIVPFSVINAKVVMVCVDGQAFIIYTGDGTSTVQTAGGCAGGDWMIELRTTQPVSNPSIPEAMPGQYLSINTPPPTEPVTNPFSEEDIKAMIDACNAGTIPKVWVDPLLLSEAALAAIYENAPMLGIYNISNSYSTVDNKYFLNIRSDKSQQVSIVIKDQNGTPVYSDSMTIPKGQSSQSLGQQTGLSGIYSIWISNGSETVVDQIVLGL